MYTYDADNERYKGRLSDETVMTLICFTGESEERNSMTKRSFKKWKVASMIVVALLAALFAFRSYNRYRYHLEKQTRFMMDTYVTIYAVGPQRLTSPAINRAMNRMQEIDAKFNSQNPESPIYAFNHKGIPISDEEVLQVVRSALEIARESGGLFDITVASLIEVWGFYGDSPRLPGEEKLRAALTTVDYRLLSLKDGRLEKKNNDIHIDLGGIAKGYAIDQAVKVLKHEGVTSALIDAGGDVYALGKKGREPWKVGLRSPRGDDLLGYVEVEDLAVMGSGDYERYFIEDGRRYHHIFNPQTGYPAEGVSGTTLIYSDPMAADAWNTAIFVLGPEEGLERVEKIPGMEAVMVTTSGEILYSSGLNKALYTIEEKK
jgi:thiamine biosynthesis lipoprotein